MNQITEEPMTDKQADTMRNDLLDLIAEIVKRIVKDPEQQAQLISELQALKH